MVHESSGFLADEAALDRDAFVFEIFEFETAIDPEEAAVHLCAEHSTALWRRPGRNEDFRVRHGAKLVALEVLERRDAPSFPSPFHGDGPVSRVRARIAHPHLNFGPRLPNLLTAVMGEGAFFSPGIVWIKLADLEFPDAYLSHFEGPAFGVAGLRDLLDARERPVFFGVVKPNVGLPPEDFAALAEASWRGGLDIPKDDEMLADAAYSPLETRARLIGEARRRAEAETGRPLMFLANVTDEVDRLIPHHDRVTELGVNSLMVNGVATGLSAVRMLRKHAKVPLVAHFDGIAPQSRVPFFGTSTVVWTRLQRLAGFDAIIMPGFGARMQTSDEEVLANVRACLDPMGGLRPCLPVPGGSDWAGTLGPTCEKLGTVDFGFVPGRGVFGHPSGPQAGAESICAAWQAVSSGTPLETQAARSPALAEALSFFGK